MQAKSDCNVDKKPKVISFSDVFASSQRAGIALAIVTVVVFRLIGPLLGPEGVKLANIAPLSAIVVASAVYLPRRAALWVPFGALFISTVAVNAVRHVPIVDPYVAAALLAFAVQYGFGLLARGTRKVGVSFGTMAASSLAFYVLTNSFSFMFDPAYAKNLSGWMQSLTAGVPGFPPTWVFFVRSLAADLAFFSLFVLVCHPFAWRSRRRLDPTATPQPVSLSA